jgi:hypothetical protein
MMKGTVAVANGGHKVLPVMPTRERIRVTREQICVTLSHAVFSINVGI